MTSSTSTPAGRVQLALNVRDIEAATRFYSDISMPPAKQRPGYTNFVVADPPYEAGPLREPGGRLRAQPPRRGGAHERRRRRGHAPLRRCRSRAHDRRGRRVLHAVQDKAWVEAPDVRSAHGSSTRFSTMTQLTEGASAGTCCATGSDLATPCCAGSGHGA